MNFKIKEEGMAYYVDFSAGSSFGFRIKSNDGYIKVPIKKWRSLLDAAKGNKLSIKIYVKGKNKQWLEFRTITNEVAVEPVDKYLYYRAIHPGFESWSDLSIRCRDIESFDTETLIDNNLIEKNCINCHSFNNGKTDDFLFHVRGSMGGTYIYRNGAFKKFNLKAGEMKNGAVYPRWHPSGDYIAFSSNKIIQQFHASGNKKVEVTDLESSLFLYDVDSNEILNIGDVTDHNIMDTYPEWSSDGKFLYFCRTRQVGEKYDYKEIRYNLYRRSFDDRRRTFGEAELVFNASAQNKSISFPRVSPDGRFLIMTGADYGCFPIWHKEADLYSVNLESMISVPLELNSDFTESYHSWSSNSKWLVFSSKRDDGLTGRPYLAYIDETGTSSKPFILPQKNPDFYSLYLKSFNIPEFSNFRVKSNPGKLRKSSESTAIPSKWLKN